MSVPISGNVRATKTARAGLGRAGTMRANFAPRAADLKSSPNQADYMWTQVTADPGQVGTEVTWTQVTR